LDDIEPMEKSTIGSALALIFKVFKVFFAIFILGLIAIVISEITIDGCGGDKLSVARGIGSAISASIQAEHLISLLMQFRIL
jgi:uncharacterized membrane-anchored protein